MQFDGGNLLRTHGCVAAWRGGLQTGIPIVSSKHASRKRVARTTFHKHTVHRHCTRFVESHFVDTCPSTFHLQRILLSFFKNQVVKSWRVIHGSVFIRALGPLLLSLSLFPRKPGETQKARRESTKRNREALRRNVACRRNDRSIKLRSTN